MTDDTSHDSARRMTGRRLFDRLRLIRDHSQHNGADLLVLLALFSYADPDGVAFPSTQTLARATRISPRTVERALMNLRVSGEVSSLRKRGPNGAIVRRIEFDVLAAKPDLSRADTNPPPVAGCSSPPAPTNPPPVAGCDVPTNPPPVTVATRHLVQTNPPSGALPNREKGPLTAIERANRESARALSPVRKRASTRASALQSARDSRSQKTRRKPQHPDALAACEAINEAFVYQGVPQRIGPAHRGLNRLLVQGCTALELGHGAWEAANRHAKEPMRDPLAYAFTVAQNSRERRLRLLPEKQHAATMLDSKVQP